MATAFGYVEREADSYVNWADVGRDMSNTIDDIQRVREEKKGLIEKTYREDLKFIQDNPSGEHETMNSWSLGVAQSSAEMMRLQNTMLKQGKLSLPNYLTFRQNITDSVEKIYTVNSQLQEAFKEVNDRSKADANQQLERETKVLLEKYGKLEDTEAYINPLNGTIYLGLTEIAEEDGKSVKRLKKGDGTYLSPDQLQAAAMQKFDKFDERPVLKTFVDGLGSVNEQIRQIGGEALAGKILSITDVTYDRIIEIADSLPEGQKLTPAQMDQLKKYAKNFEEAETKYIQGILKNPFNASSLLTENGISKDGKTYNIVFNKDDQKTEYDIYVDKTDSKFTPIFDEKTEIGKKQKEALTDYLRGQLRVMYDRKVEQQAINEPVKQKDPPPNYGRPSAAEIQAGKEEEDINADIEKIRLLVEGSPAQKTSMLSWITSQPGISQAKSKYDEKNNQLLIYSKDPEITEPIVYEFGSNLPIQDFVLNVSAYAWPEMGKRYTSYIDKMDPTKRENVAYPYEDDINKKTQYIRELEEQSIVSPGLKNNNDAQIVKLKEEIAELEKKQAAQVKRQGQGGRTTTKPGETR
tara:strand:+ start:2874 stop:4610 length:1737 start_codon:yes stop_codon:yes gene_type:complete